MPDVFDFPRRAALIDTIASYFDNNTIEATRLVDLYSSLDVEALGKDVRADPSAPDAFWVAMAIYTDLYMDIGKQILLREASKKAATWGYDFRQQPPLNSLNLSYEYPGASEAFARRVGVYHGAELPYVFGEATRLEDRTQGDDYVAIAIMDAWIAFAYYLDPNGLSVDATGGSWPLYNSSATGAVMIFEDQRGLPIRSEPQTMRTAVYEAWDSALSA